MAWRLRKKLRKAPKGADMLLEKLEDFESQMRAATSAPRGDRMNHELTWPVHRLHYEKNRYLHELHASGAISPALLKYLVREKVADGPLLARWRTPGYETVCSLAVITRSNTNFGTVGVCRTPLADRRTQIAPNVLTGCVCCASGAGGPIWWNDPVPEAALRRIVEIDPGKADLVDEAKGLKRAIDEEGEGDYGEGEGGREEDEREGGERKGDEREDDVAPAPPKKKPRLDAGPDENGANGANGKGEAEDDDDDDDDEDAAGSGSSSGGGESDAGSDGEGAPRKRKTVERPHSSSSDDGGESDSASGGENFDA